MLRRLFAVLAATVASVTAVSAQESDSPKYSFYSAVETGYEVFSKTYRQSGCNINFNIRYYFGDAFYGAFLAHGGFYSGGRMVGYERDGAEHATRLGNEVNEWMTGIGAGMDLYRNATGRSAIYLTGVVGYGANEEDKDRMTAGAELHSYLKHKGVAASVAVGWDFMSMSSLFLGVALNGYYIGDRVNAAANLRVGLMF